MNWDDEQQAGVALRTLLDEPAPPPVISFEQVLRRGRRRVRVRRLGVVALVFAMVALAAGGGILLRSVSAEQPSDLLAGPVVEIDPGPWPEQLIGWTVVSSATCEPPQDRGLRQDTVAIPPREVVEPAFVSAVAIVIETDGLSTSLVEWSDPGRGFLQVDVPMGSAAGSVQLEITRTAAGSPVQAADADVNVYGTCAVPMRKTLDSGTVMQLYAPDARSPYAPIQHLRTYLPNGVEYWVTSAGWSLADVSATAGDTAGIVRTGRGRLPLSSQQLSDIAVRLADLE